MRPCRLAGIINRDVLIRTKGKPLTDDGLQFVEALRRSVKSD